MTQFFGKYRGKVESNVDPLKLGRLQISCPAVLGEGTLSWALPATPYAGSQVGLFLIPPNGSNIWVEFEGGDTNHAIWSGCFWGDGEVPASPPLADTKMLKTAGVTLTLEDKQGGGGAKLEVGSPAVSTPLTLTMDSNGIELKTAQATVKLSQSGIDIVNASASVKLTSSGIDVVNSSASVKLTAASVSVNNGALEVV